MGRGSIGPGKNIGSDDYWVREVSGPLRANRPDTSPTHYFREVSGRGSNGLGKYRVGEVVRRGSIGPGFNTVMGKSKITICVVQVTRPSLIFGRHSRP